MADYKELLRRAVEALPENNGAARRAVYEKARSALVGQLRGINPPLPARDITTHRLQLEDCIRQVEQEASEANIAGMTEAPPPPKAEAPAKAVPKAPEPKPADTRPPVAAKVPNKPMPAVLASDARKGGTIEDIIAAAERDNRVPPPKVETRGPEIKARPPKSAPVLVTKNSPPPPLQQSREPEPPQRPAARPNGRPLPSIVARAEASKSKPSAPTFGTPIDGRGRSGGVLEPRRDGRSNALAARQVEADSFEEPQDIEAMSAVREVEVEQQSADPQGAIDRAIATLDREARGDEQIPYDDDDAGDEPMQAPLPPPRRNGHANGALVNGVMRDEVPIARGGARKGRPSKPAREFAAGATRRGGRSEHVPRAMRETERGGFGAVAIFLTVFVVLLFGAGGAGIWAWQAGYLNIDAMFASGTEQPAATANAEAPRTDATGPGNTTTPPNAVEATARVVGDTATPAATSSPVTALASPPSQEARLDATTASETTFTDPTVDSTAGSQSLLLEASDSGSTGAVAVSGDINWSKGTDENGQPTLIGKATIPARNLSVEVLIRKNADAQLPASHLMEINFTVGSSFVGGSIAGLPGVLLKNEELVQGVPLVGASARVVGNQFLFALTTVPEDKAANINLLTTRKWMDLALIYASGKRAIITLEKDAAAQQLFTDVFAAWDQTATN